MDPSWHWGRLIGEIEGEIAPSQMLYLCFPEHRAALIYTKIWERGLSISQLSQSACQSWTHPEAETKTLQGVSSQHQPAHSGIQYSLIDECWKCKNTQTLHVSDALSNISLNIIYSYNKYLFVFAWKQREKHGVACQWYLCIFIRYSSLVPDPQL